MGCAQRKLRSALVVEVALVGAGCVLAVLAAVHASGGQLASVETWGLALAGGFIGGLCLHLELRSDGRRLASVIDHRLGLDGMLLTAYEHSGEGAVVDLLEQRLLEEVRPADVRRAFPTYPLPYLAVPLTAAILLASSIEQSRQEAPRQNWVMDAVAGLEEDVQAALELAYEARDSDRLSGDELDELLDQRAEARELARRAGAQGAGAEPGPELRGELEQLCEELGRTARELAQVPEVSRELERASMRLDGALLNLDGLAGDAPVAQQSPEGQPSSPGADPEQQPGPREAASDPVNESLAGPGAGAAGEADPSGERERTGVQGQDGGPGTGEGLAPGAGEGTMSGPPDFPKVPTKAPGASTSAAGSPPPAGSGPATQFESPYWSPEQAPLLQRWMESRQRRLEADRP